MVDLLHPFGGPQDVLARSDVAADDFDLAGPSWRSSLRVLLPGGAASTKDTQPRAFDSPQLLDQVFTQETGGPGDKDGLHGVTAGRAGDERSGVPQPSVGSVKSGRRPSEEDGAREPSGSSTW